MGYRLALAEKPSVAAATTPDTIEPTPAPISDAADKETPEDPENGISHPREPDNLPTISPSPLVRATATFPTTSTDNFTLIVVSTLAGSTGISPHPGT